MYELRLCITKDCNFKCTYCRPGGEGIYNKNPNMEIDEIKKCIYLLSKEGFDSVRITGGEPFVRKDIVDVINAIGAIEGITNVSLVTNGSLLNYEIIQKLAASKLASITVSLDTFDRDKFKSIVNVDCFDKVIENIILLRSYQLKTRINMVLTAENMNHLAEIMEFCSKHTVDLKILDLNNNGLENWSKKYVDLTLITENLRKNCLKEDILLIRGNVGTPMSCFNFGNYNVIIKDSKKGTCYVEDCQNCKFYPCQTGVISPIITHDGYVKFCNLGDPADFNILKLSEAYKAKFDIFNQKFKALYFSDDWSNSVKE